MPHHAVTRIVTLSGGGLRAPQDRPKLPDRLIHTLLRLLSGYVLAHAEGHLASLQDSGLYWTVVRGIGRASCRERVCWIV